MEQSTSFEPYTFEGRKYCVILAYFHNNIFCHFREVGVQLGHPFIHLSIIHVKSSIKVCFSTPVTAASVV